MPSASPFSPVRGSRNARSFLNTKPTPVHRATRRLAVETLERRELLTAGPAEAVVNLQGTDGDDVFEFAPGAEDGTWLVSLNGKQSKYEANSIQVLFDGGDGNDSAKLIGNDLADVISLRPGEGTMASNAYSLDLQGCETITVDARGGANIVHLYDSAGDDELKTTPDSAVLEGDGFKNSVTSVSQVRGYAEAGGYDVAFLHDDPNGPDRFRSAPGWARLDGAEFGARAFGFSRVYAYATSGDDAAVVEDLAGSRDKVLIMPDHTKFNGKGGTLRLFDFADVRVDATSGDNDVARIYGSEATSNTLTVKGSQVELDRVESYARTRGFWDTRIYGDLAETDTADLSGTPKQKDKVVISPKYAKISSDDYRVRAFSFTRTTAHGEPDSNETVVFYDRANQPDALTADATSANLFGNGYNHIAEGFSTIYAFATRGDGDKTRLFSGDDEQGYFEADPKVGILRTDTLHIQVRHFDTVNAYATPDSDVTAVMYTEEGNANKVNGCRELSMLRGEDFVRKAIGFRNVHVYADPYTKHLAKLVDSEQDDVFTATSEYGELSGDDYNIRVVSFHEVRAAASNGGNDEAVIYDTDEIDHLVVDASAASMVHMGSLREFSIETTAFEQVQMSSSNDEDIRDVAPGSVEWLSTGTSDAEGGVDDEAADEALAELGQETADQPNVLFIAVDDLNDWVGVLGGYADVQTPNMNRLAARGVTFSQAYCPAPFCNPSRSAVLTGYYPTTSGVYKNTEDWRVAVPDAVTLPELFKENGYETVGGGKILHWNDRALWDEYYSRISDPEPTADVLQDEDNSMGVLEWGAVDVPDEEMNDYRITSWAADYLLQEHDSPFFLAAGVFRPHVPLNVPQSYFDLYPLDEIVLPETISDDLDDLPAVAREQMESDSLDADLKEAGNRERVVQAYLASVTFADAQIGRILDALESSEYADNTVVALWSDHGMHFGEKEHWKKGTLWEEATRVPLIISGPGVAEPGSISEHPVDLVNLYPTLADLCDLPVDESLDGVSLVPLLEDPDADWDRPALMNNRDDNAIRYKEWRYIRYGDGSEELYDHSVDPNEWHNLADDPAYQQIKADLEAMLPEQMAIETPKRLNSPLHWDSILPDAVPDPIVSAENLFFSEYDTSTGRELWMTNGDVAPTLVADINPGPDSSTPRNLLDWNGVTYFTASDGTHGEELWRTDGTSSGTWMVSDIRAGAESSEIGELVAADDRLYFRADDGVHGAELWSTDGTADGTRLVSDALEGESSSYPSELAAVGTSVFFRACQPSTGVELWHSDGTAATTTLVADILAGTKSSIPIEIVAARDGAYFHADDGIHGREVWFSNGTSEGTYLVQDLETGADGSKPEQLTYNGTCLYFVAHGDGGRGLWKHDDSAESAQLVHRDTGKGSVAVGIDELTAIGSLLYFQGSVGGTGPEIWITDGTEEGTMMLRDIRDDGFGSYPSEFTALGDQVIFTADDGIHGTELWATDGTAEGTELLTDLFPGLSGSDPRFLSMLGETLVFFATDGETPYRPWRIVNGVLEPIRDLNQ